MKRKTFEERFWDFANRAGADECWVWSGVVTSKGYGHLRVNGKFRLAHRVSYDINVGPIPHGMIVRHTCDNPPCVNPGHLEPGTHKENAEDRRERGRDRHMIGAAHFASKLTEQAVAELRGLRAAGWTYRALAIRYSVSETTARYAVMNGWRTAGEPSGERVFRKRLPKTECDHGHKMTPENTRVGSDGARRCRECMNRKRRKWNGSRS